MFRHTLPLRTLVVIMALSLGIATLIAHSALAADLSNGSDQTCNGSGVWHFVNNQVSSSVPPTLTAEFSCGDQTVVPSKVTPGTVHFIVLTDGDCTLEDASTNLDGRLQLSDFTCTPKKCDPKTDPKCVP